MQEGVIKFDVRFEAAPPPPADWLRDLIAWRAALWRRGLIGVDPARYGGAGFGNVSRRLPTEAGRGFMVSASQSATHENVSAGDFVIVSAWDVAANRIDAHGVARPSSESLTHAMVYDLHEAVQYVFHVHAPPIWQAATRLDPPTTARDIEYGTPAMAREVVRLYGGNKKPTHGVFAMGGHEDGVVSFATDAETAGRALLDLLDRVRR